MFLPGTYADGVPYELLRELRATRPSAGSRSRRSDPGPRAPATGRCSGTRTSGTSCGTRGVLLVPRRHPAPRPGHRRGPGVRPGDDAQPGPAGPHPAAADRGRRVHPRAVRELEAVVAAARTRSSRRSRSAARPTSSRWRPICRCGHWPG
ncbi:hypothetical protein NKH77_03000 [Streptomyces sp. M19]